MSQSAAIGTSRDQHPEHPAPFANTPRHARLFELLRQQSLAGERYFPPPAQECEQVASSVARFQRLAQASLDPQRGA
ncbi:MAG: hypothetical protein AAF678_10450 [Pseudomonadota bacterium]